MFTLMILNSLLFYWKWMNSNNHIMLLTSNPSENNGHDDRKKSYPSMKQTWWSRLSENNALKKLHHYTDKQKTLNCENIEFSVKFYDSQNCITQTLDYLHTHQKSALWINHRTLRYLTIMFKYCHYIGFKTIFQQCFMIGLNRFVYT
jgi:hypothetical protein